MTTSNSNIIFPPLIWDGLTRKQQISLMDEYYSNNTLYQNTIVLRHYLGWWSEDLRPLRSPVHRSVEFFSSKVPMGEPVISSKTNPAITQSVSQILEWSNFQIVKSKQVRSMAKYGDLFRKVVSENGKVWHEMVETAYVTDYKADPRGFLTEIRIDTPIVKDGIQSNRTEFWTVNDSVPYMAVWEHRLSEMTTIEQIARAVDPIMYSPLSAFGIDFIPFVRSTFADTGKKWGANCVEHALLKIDEANRMSTRLHQTLFRYNKPTFLLSSNQVLPDGTPVPAPDTSNIEIRDNSIIPLAGNNTLETLIPNVDYAAALDILKSQEAELEQDLPELRYFMMADNQSRTGKAMKNLMGAAVDRAENARSSFLEGTIRANQMAITIGQFQGIFDDSLGTFDNGDFNHSIRLGDMFPADASEKASTLQVFVSAGIPLPVAMKLSDFSDEEVAMLNAAMNVQVPDTTPSNENETSVTPMQTNQVGNLMDMSQTLNNIRTSRANL